MSACSGRRFAAPLIPTLDFRSFKVKPPKQANLAVPSTQKWWACPDVVYFLGAGSPIVIIKIGRFSIPATMTLKSALLRRLRQIQGSNHEAIQVFGLVQITTGEFPTRQTEELERHSSTTNLRTWLGSSRAPKAPSGSMLAGAHPTSGGGFDA